MKKQKIKNWIIKNWLTVLMYAMINITFIAYKNNWDSTYFIILYVLTLATARAEGDYKQSFKTDLFKGLLSKHLEIHGEKSEDKIKKHSLIERIKYTHKRGWFCRRRILWFNFPVIASDMSIHTDLIWRDIQAKKKKREANIKANNISK